MQKLQVLITQQNIQLEKLFHISIENKNSDGKEESNNQNRLFSFKEFSLIINVLDPTMRLEEIELFYERLDPDQKGVTIEDFKELLVEKDYSEFEAYEDPFFEEKSERVIYVLRQTILKNKIDIDRLFQVFDISGNDELSFEEFERLILEIHPIISHEESNYLFQKLDYDKSGDISLSEFKAYVLRDARLEEKLKKIENKYHAIRKEFRNLIMNQKLHPEKVFEKFKRENEDKISFEGISKFLKVLDPKIDDEEEEYIFQRMDVGNVGYLTKEKFITGLLE